MSQPAGASRTAVYRFFDASGLLLYVGVTDQPTVRFAAHRASSAWWTSVDHVRTRVSWHATREEGELAERRAIEIERPEFNVLGKDGYRGGRRKVMPSAEVAKRIDHVVALYRQQQQIEAAYREELARLTNKEGDAVPIAHVADRLGVERKTVYRHLGRSMT
jgi:predicted GIY-YIG superfamily endonuclease